MKKKKLEKGITLVALIITIVVLLILAVVSIGAVKNSGIIGHATNTSSENIVSQEKEQITLALNEWYLQKNTPNNITSFKSVVESSLKDENVTIIGEEDGPLTVTFTKTSNKYRISTDGEIVEGAKMTGTALEKYIFGKKLAGRDWLEIIDMSNGIGFKDEADTIPNASTEISFIKIFTYSQYSSDMYIRYEDEIYKFKMVASDSMTTEAFYGITKIEVETENTRVGKTVSYDGKTWTIMYDDSTNGLQMICNETYQYNGGNFRLGYGDSLITSWDDLKLVVDLDKDGNLSNVEKTIYSYNNAITTLNTACEKLFKLENGNYKNSNIIDVRCVGSNPTSKNLENAKPYTSKNLKNWANGRADGIAKSTDLNYVTDLDRTVFLGILLNEDFWMASRWVSEESNVVEFSMRNPYNSCKIYLWKVNSTTINCNEYRSESPLCPIISLRSGDVLEASNTEGIDYTLNN